MAKKIINIDITHSKADDQINILITGGGINLNDERQANLFLDYSKEFTRQIAGIPTEAEDINTVINKLKNIIKNKKK